MSMLATIPKLPANVVLTATEERGLFELRDHHARLGLIVDQLLPVEATANSFVVHERAMVRRRLLRAEMRALGAVRLGLDILGGKTSDGLPALAIFDLDHNAMWIAEDRMGWNSRVAFGTGWRNVEKTNVDIPDVLMRAIGRAGRGAAVAVFSGVLPACTRERIQRYRALCDDGMYIIAEVEWRSVTMDRDPLLVALDGDVFWLVDKFDVTPIEQLVLDEPGSLNL